MSEEDVVSLVVEGDGSLSTELRLEVEEGGQHAAHGVTQPRREVVQDHLRTERGDLAPILLDLTGNLDIAQPASIRKKIFNV